eukprot:Skav212235  [mRNA]  locus=scaffold4106:32021:33207:+ [translate_table: standard]
MMTQTPPLLRQYLAHTWGTERDPSRKGSPAPVLEFQPSRPDDCFLPVGYWAIASWIMAAAKLAKDLGAKANLQDEEMFTMNKALMDLIMDGPLGRAYGGLKPQTSTTTVSPDEWGGNRWVQTSASP